MPCEDCLGLKAEIAGQKAFISQWFNAFLKQIKSLESKFDDVDSKSAEFRHEILGRFDGLENSLLRNSQSQLSPSGVQSDGETQCQNGIEVGVPYSSDGTLFRNDLLAGVLVMKNQEETSKPNHLLHANNDTADYVITGNDDASRGYSPFTSSLNKGSSAIKVECANDYYYTEATEKQMSINEPSSGAEETPPDLVSNDLEQYLVSIASTSSGPEKDCSADDPPKLKKIKLTSKDQQLEDSKPKFKRKRVTLNKIVNCKICDKEITGNPFHFRRHVMNIHLREKPYKCSVCHRLAATKANVLCHMRKLHPELTDLTMESVAEAVDIQEFGSRLLQKSKECFPDYFAMVDLKDFSFFKE